MRQHQLALPRVRQMHVRQLTSYRGCLPAGCVNASLRAHASLRHAFLLEMTGSHVTWVLELAPAKRLPTLAARPPA
eukprot:1158269-Pelagomonas_calceolata.AAC.13